jgi:ATP-dependent Lhr-like helicase
LRAVGQVHRSNHRRRSAIARSNGIGGAGPPGRWAAIGVPDHDLGDEDRHAEKVAGVLLGRYGVLFRDLMQRESFTMPWRLVLKALRRLEARGEVRGGRLVSGFVGEQYALPEAVTALRQIRREPLSGEAVRIGAADLLNLTGIVIPGPRIPSHSGQAITLVDGLPVPVNASHEPVAASVR